MKNNLTNSNSWLLLLILFLNIALLFGMFLYSNLFLTYPISIIGVSSILVATAGVIYSKEKELTIKHLELDYNQKKLDQEIFDENCKLIATHCFNCHANLHLIINSITNIDHLTAEHINPLTHAYNLHHSHFKAHIYLYKKYSNPELMEKLIEKNQNIEEEVYNFLYPEQKITTQNLESKRDDMLSLVQEFDDLIIEYVQALSLPQK